MTSVCTSREGASLLESASLSFASGPSMRPSFVDAFTSPELSLPVREASANHPPSAAPEPLGCERRSMWPPQSASAIMANSEATRVVMAEEVTSCHRADPRTPSLPVPQSAVPQFSRPRVNTAAPRRGRAEAHGAA